MKKLVYYSILISIMLVITSILGEISLRVYNHFSPIYIFNSQSQPYNQYRGRPYQKDYDFNLNSIGFKDVEFEKARIPGRYRILAIGDSYNFGIVPYQHNFLTLLEQHLQEAGKDVEIYNMGIPSTGPADYLELLENEGLAYKPDLVLCTFFTGNDYEPVVRDTSWLASIYLYQLYQFLKVTLVDAHWFYFIETTYSDDMEVIDEEAWLNVQMSMLTKYVKQPGLFQPNFAIEKLVDMQQKCATNNIEFMVVIAPEQLAVDTALQNRLIKHTGFESDKFDFELPPHELPKILEASDIHYINLYPFLKAASNPGSLYKSTDIHWNMKGNHFVAEVLAQQLQQLP